VIYMRTMIIEQNNVLLGMIEGKKSI
jgi:hypothetical protein